MIHRISLKIKTQKLSIQRLNGEVNPLTEYAL